MSEESTQPNSEATRREIRGSSLLLGGQLLSKLSNFGIQVLIIRVLTRDDFGAFAYALSLVALGQTLVTFGLDKAMPRFLPIYQEQGETRKFYGLLLLGGLVILGLSALLIPAVYLSRPWLVGGWVRSEQAASLFLILVFLVPAQAIDMVLIGLLAIFGATRRIFVRRHVITPILKMSAIAIALIAGWDVTGLAYAYLVANVVGVAFSVFLLARVMQEEKLPRNVLRQSKVFPVRDMLWFTIPLISSDIVLTMAHNIDAIMLERFRGTHDVAGLRAVSRVAVMNQIVMASFTTLFLPAAARSLARRDFKALNQSYWQTSLWVTVLTFPLFLLTFAGADSVVKTLFGERYADAGVLLSLLSLGCYFNAALGLNGLTLKIYERMRYVLMMNLTSAVFAFVANLVLIPRWGAFGAALATTLMLIGFNTMKHAGLWKMTDVKPYERSFLPIHAFVVIASLGLLAFNLAFSPSFWINCILSALLSGLLLLISREQMQIGTTFPELRRVPILGPLLAR